jgi:hypothetical protein
VTTALRPSLRIGVAGVSTAVAVLISCVFFLLLGAFNFANFIAGGFISAGLFAISFLLLFPLRKNLGIALFCGLSGLGTVAWVCELVAALWGPLR